MFHLKSVGSHHGALTFNPTILLDPAWTHNTPTLLQAMSSESDVIILSCLTKAPATSEATSAVRAALQSVVVRSPLARIHNPGPRGAPATAVGAGGAGGTPNLRAISPAAHSAIIDNNLLRAFTAARARTILAGLSPPAAAGSGTSELPTVVAGVAGGPSGLCFLGQRATAKGFSAFSVRRESESEDEEGGAVEGAAAAAGGEQQAFRIDDLIHEYGDGRARASARALYDLWGTSNGDVVGAALRDGGASAGPFARLATEWDCSSHATRNLGSAPPPACSSLLLVGGDCPPSTVTLALRGDIEALSTAAATGQARKGRGPFGGGDVGGGGDGRAAGDGSAGGEGVGASSPGSERQERLQWEEDLQALLSGSENMAELAARPRNANAGDDERSDDRREAAGELEEDTAVQDRRDGGGLGEEVGSGRQEPAGKLRGDLDFSERLWELAARAKDVEGVRSAVSSAFDAVGDGQIFPVINRDNRTAAGVHIREGVALAREARYHDGAAVGGGGGGGGGGGARRDGAKARAWRERGSALLADAETLARAFVELGVHKVTRDLLHGLEVNAGVLAADVDRVLPATTAGDRPSPSEGAGAGTGAGDRRLDRLLTLADTLDLVALAQSYGAPWRQVRALAHSGLATLGRTPPSSSSSSAAPSASSSPSLVFSLGLPKPIPPRARCKLAHPVFWELCLEPAARGGGGAEGPTETVSYTMANAALFQLRGVDTPPVLSGEAARAAQAALRGVADHLIPEVLLSVTGVESFVELKRRQLELRAKGASTGGDEAAVFVCEQRFTPW